MVMLTNLFLWGVKAYIKGVYKVTKFGVKTIYKGTKKGIELLKDKK
jgi:hypothetical protein